MSRPELGVLLLAAVLCGLLSALAASKKGRSSGGYFVLGCLTGPVGLVIALAMSANRGLAGFAALNPYRAARAHPGWYQDPKDPHVLRWHDGVNWTQQAYDTRPTPTESRSRSSPAG